MHRAYMTNFKSGSSGLLHYCYYCFKSITQIKVFKVLKQHWKNPVETNLESNSVDLPFPTTAVT